MGGSTKMIRLLFLISNFHHVVNVVFFLLGDCSSSDAEESPKRKNTTWLLLFRIMPTILVGFWFSIGTGVSMFICGQLCVCIGTLYYRLGLVTCNWLWYVILAHTLSQSLWS